MYLVELCMCVHWLGWCVRVDNRYFVSPRSLFSNAIQTNIVALQKLMVVLIASFYFSDQK